MRAIYGDDWSGTEVEINRRCGCETPKEYSSLRIRARISLATKDIITYDIAMAIETFPLPLPPTADPSKFKDFGREVKGVHPGRLTDEEFKEIQQLLYKVCVIPQYPCHSLAYRSSVQHDALLFRNVHLSPEEQYKLTKVRQGGIDDMYCRHDSLFL